MSNREKRVGWMARLRCPSCAGAGEASGFTELTVPRSVFHISHLTEPFQIKRLGANLASTVIECSGCGQRANIEQ